MGYSIFDETMVDLTWPEIEEAIRHKAVVLLPIGVIEEHGPHLGLAVDLYVSYLLAKMARKHLENDGIRTLIAPPYYWGINDLTGVFPGSFTVRPETMQAVLYDILACLKKWGVNYAFTFNWHAELKHNRAILEAVREVRLNTGLQAYVVLSELEAHHFKLSGAEDYLAVHREVPASASSSPYLDLHAGSQETAIMLEYFSEQVKAGMINSLKNSRTTKDDIIAMSRDSDEVRRRLPLGYFGNPSACNLEEATREIEALARADAEIIKKIVPDNEKSLFTA